MDPKQIPIDLYRFGAVAVAGPALVVVVMITRCLHQQPSSQNLQKQGLLLTSPRGYTTPPEPHNEVGVREGGTGRNLGFCFYWGLQVGCLGFCSFTLYW